MTVGEKAHTHTHTHTHARTHTHQYIYIYIYIIIQKLQDKGLWGWGGSSQSRIAKSTSILKPSKLMLLLGLLLLLEKEHNNIHTFSWYRRAVGAIGARVARTPARAVKKTPAARSIVMVSISKCETGCDSCYSCFNNKGWWEGERAGLWCWQSLLSLSLLLL